MKISYGRLALTSGALLLAGCTTTGDPRQGGLFGWSEQQAMSRQERLSQDDQLARQQLATEQQRTVALSGGQAALATESVNLQAELERLLDENNTLNGQLRNLMQTRQLKQDQMARLRKILADNEKTRGAVRGAATGPAQSPASQVGALSGQNARLHREVMILLQQ